jgi:hypothetical protein
MDRSELIALLKHHKVHQIWCYGCARNVGSAAEHIADLLMPPGVDWLLTAKELPDEEKARQL